MSVNKVEKSIKRRKNAVIQSVKWIVVGVMVGFILTLGFSIFEASRTGLMNSLINLVNTYFNLVLEIADRNPNFASFILHSQDIAEAQVNQGVAQSNSFIATHFAGLNAGSTPDDKVALFIDNLKYDFFGLCYLAQWSLKLVIVKFVSVFCSFMVYVFAGILGLMDGLLTRYIKTAEGGRESTYVYHHVAGSLFKIPFCLVVAYLALPLPLNPLLVVVILAIATFLFCKVSTSNLKKYM